MLARSTACRHGRRVDLGEEDVDQQQVTVADEQVGRLDVAVGQPGVPQLPDEGEAVVDDPVVDVGLAEFDRAVEELGDQQILPLGGELRESIGSRRGQPGQRASCAACSPPAAPAVARCGRASRPPAGRTAARGRACTSGRPAGGCGHRACRTATARVAGDLDAQRRRPGRAGQPERLDVLDRQPELVLAAPGGSPRRGHPPTSRCAARPRR